MLFMPVILLFNFFSQCTRPGGYHSYKRQVENKFAAPAFHFKKRISAEMIAPFQMDGKRIAAFPVCIH
jgi:hypothetical protein